MKEVPVIVLGHLSPAQRRALVIADNQLAINGAGLDEGMRRNRVLIGQAGEAGASEPASKDG